MEGLVNGIYNVCDALQPVALAVLVLMLAILGIETIVGGQDGHMRFKESIKWILIGSGVVFGASTIGKTIASWFGV